LIVKFPEEVKVALVTAACMLGTAVVFKNILHVQADSIVSNGPLYLLIVYLLAKGQVDSIFGKPLVWSFAIVFVALLTVLLYAI
jgi:hypothetical protein